MAVDRLNEIDRPVKNGLYWQVPAAKLDSPTETTQTTTFLEKRLKAGQRALVVVIPPSESAILTELERPEILEWFATKLPSFVRVDSIGMNTRIVADPETKTVRLSTY